MAGAGDGRGDGRIGCAAPKPAEARALSLFAAVDEAESSDGPSAEEVEELGCWPMLGWWLSRPRLRCLWPTARLLHG